MVRYVEGYNQRTDGRRIWLIQASDDAGWNWEKFLPHSHQEPVYGWGGANWIKSASSIKRVSQEFVKGDLVICYQAAPLKAVVGLARLASGGYVEPGKRHTDNRSRFDLDWGCFVKPVTLSAMKSNPVLAQSEKVRVGQGSIFRLSSAELVCLLAMTEPVGVSVREVEEVLGIEWTDCHAPTANDEELDLRVHAIRSAGPIARPSGQKTPRAILRGDVTAYERDPKVKAWVLQDSGGKCELCMGPAPFLNAAHEPFLETHHVRSLANGGSDTPENTVAICPNCHRRVHHGSDANEQIRRLYAQVSRLVRE